ncbi:hypothetical protein HDEF_0326 [Candidatus Hamiltonella defensa 5AT (Acyrthosiphon pisum)]|uniref:Uncharacterized protein n=1 Tax=Hamiltonella defensa subsp. Acyrthosiphon pisum (strain 5AT) TaxID=572265 RepID=C4K3E5_HAMD5|nr:hypothetical protein HDEF_0326 [Candidatus Hamiltonella defensa 5AT (Acyrthosiphon pisum)]
MSGLALMGQKQAHLLEGKALKTKLNTPPTDLFLFYP